MPQAPAPQLGKAALLAQAFVTAGRYHGMSQTELGEAVGKDRTAISRGRVDPKQMRHWMRTATTTLAASPPTRSTVIALAILIHLREVRSILAVEWARDLFRSALGGKSC